ncbi:MAG TPA: hypothetical protein VMT45_03410 [Thermoanaerobaculaceae bacterium]|nr:hypothetical protein [Thermoanaerobaculaceae bacterium]
MDPTALARRFVEAVNPHAVEGPAALPPDRQRPAWLGLGTVVLAMSSALGYAAPAHPPIAILSLHPADAVTSRAYASAFQSVGYPTRWVAPEGLAGITGAVLVVPQAEVATLSEDTCRRIVSFVEEGGRLVTAGASPLTRALGVRFTKPSLLIEGISERRAPSLRISWRSPATFEPYVTPAPARTFACTLDGRRPVVSAFALGSGMVLLLGVELDEENPLGRGRFPYFLQAVGAAFGVAPPAMVHRITAYADISDHHGQDPTQVARAWYQRGIREVHVGAWDAFDANQAYFSRLIAACHRYGVLVYAWLEPPEVSTRFWSAHPEWREKTATGADAQVDWRRLMALNIPKCFEAVARGLSEMILGLDWDGVDLAEIYLESPAGLERPELFTPMNRALREEFERFAGFDPQDLFDESSIRFWRKDQQSLTSFLDFRRGKVAELHQRLMDLLESARRQKPHLDLVLTLVDALYDTRMRDWIGIDTPRITALLAGHTFALQVEDPYTLWALGPERYGKIAADYARLVPPGQRLSVDINVVPRADGVHPTAQQTGLELYRLVSEARRAFPRICFYSEGTIYPQDRDLLLSALASTASVEVQGREAMVESDQGVELEIGEGPHRVRMDGTAWPARHGGAVLVPSGKHEVAWEAGTSESEALQLRDINAVLLGLSAKPDTLAVHYAAPTRAFLLLSFRPGRLEVDGGVVAPTVEENEYGFVLVAPPGEHTVALSLR